MYLVLAASVQNFETYVGIFFIIKLKYEKKSLTFGNQSSPRKGKTQEYVLFFKKTNNLYA